MPRVIVAGSVNMDVVAFAERHPRVGETVQGDSVAFSPGGKGANQAVAAARLGASTVLVGKIGSDAFGDQLKEFLASQGVDLTYVQAVEEAGTGTALIVVADSDNTIVAVPGANALVRADDASEVAIGSQDVLVSQLEIPEDAIIGFFDRGKSLGATTILTPAPARPCSDEIFELCDILVVNETELSFFLGRGGLDSSSTDGIAAAARALRRREDQTIVVTVGGRGAIAVTHQHVMVIPARKVEAVDTTGAGDCFVGALAAGLVRGDSLDSALLEANLAASICVQPPRSRDLDANVGGAGSCESTVVACE